MRIGGLNQFSLSDFPGRTSAMIFTQGCNFRCPFCHNGPLIPLIRPTEELIPWKEVFQFLEKRQGQLDGIVVTGGEPTLQPDLFTFFQRLKTIGYQTKLDTNGSHPEVLKKLFTEDIVDFIAMDIKAPFAIYDCLAGVHAPVEKLKESIALIAESGIEHEFRTTVVKSLLSEDDLEIIKKMVPKGSKHRFQEFRPENAYDPKLRGKNEK